MITYVVVLLLLMDDDDIERSQASEGEILDRCPVLVFVAGVCVCCCFYLNSSCSVDLFDVAFLCRCHTFLIGLNLCVLILIVACFSNSNRINRKNQSWVLALRFCVTGYN